MVASIRHDNVAINVHRQGHRIIEPRRITRAVRVAALAFSRTRERAHRTISRDLADAVIVGICDESIAFLIHCHTLGG